MSNSWHHAVSASHKWGGTPHDYLKIEEFIDGSKAAMGDVRHRALYHHTAGVFLVERIFGPTITIVKRNGTGTYEVPTREIAERHIVEDLGYIPSPSDWLTRRHLRALPRRTPRTPPAGCNRPRRPNHPWRAAQARRR